MGGVLHARASYSGLCFRPPGFSPYREREERAVVNANFKNVNANFMSNPGSACAITRARGS